MIMQADVNRLKDQIQGASGDVDLLLTCEWPENILLSLPPNPAPEGINKSGIASEELQDAGSLSCISALTPLGNFVGLSGSASARLKACKSA